MADPGPRPSPTAEQLAWLRVAPPTDEHDQPIRWTLADCKIEESKWTDAIVHELLTIERVEITALQWQGPVFRKCVIRKVQFERTSFTHARFHKVSFEDCSFARSTFENVVLEDCEFLDCTIRSHTAIRTTLRACKISGLGLDVIDMRECDLSGTRFIDSRLNCPRISKTRADSLELRGGELRGADLTACPLTKLTLSKVAIGGLRVLDCTIGDAEFVDGPIEGLAISGTKFNRLAFVRCPELPGARVIDSTITELMLDGCPAVASLLIADSTITSLAARACTFYDAAFERLVVGRGWFEAGALTGVLFVAGEWTKLALLGVALNDYVAVKQTRFAQLRFDQPAVDPQLDLRLDGDTYANGSMNWSSLAGDVRGA